MHICTHAYVYTCMYLSLGFMYIFPLTKMNDLIMIIMIMVSLNNAHKHTHKISENQTYLIYPGAFRVGMNLEHHAL